MTDMHDTNAQLERFRICADAYGADRRRWPQRDHAIFDACATTPRGAAMLAAAERTDLFLDAWPVSAARGDHALVERIANATADRAPARHRRRMVWSAAAFAMSAVLGFAIGFMQAPDEPSAEFVSQLLIGPSGAPGIGL